MQGIEHTYFCQVYFFRPQPVNTLRPRKNGHHIAYDIFKSIFLHENYSILIQFSLQLISEGPPINN